MSFRFKIETKPESDDPDKEAPKDFTSQLKMQEVQVAFGKQ